MYKRQIRPVEDVFSITGRGTVATGRIEAGVIHVGDEVEILGLGEDKKSVDVYKRQSWGCCRVRGNFVFLLRQQIPDSGRKE